jgi:hypothetical protein
MVVLQFEALGETRSQFFTMRHDDQDRPGILIMSFQQ